MIIQLEYPFNKDWRKGYLRNSSDGRKRIDLYNSVDDRTTISYARYLVSVNIGRYLTDQEEVDHIDSDRSNDVIGNLQILSTSDHRSKTSKEMKTGRTCVTLECPNCSKLFKREARCVKKGTLPKCSRKCNGEYNRKVQLGKCKKK